jgi:LemA protein
MMRHRIAILTLALVTLTTATGCGYNKMVTMNEAIDAAWAQVENQLQRRNDLIPNLVETTKGYATHEQQIFTRIADARSRLIGAGSRDAKIEAASELGENRIATERRRYNEAVREYNTYIKTIPAAFTARMFGFKEEKYFEAPKEAQQVPKVQF